MSMSQRTASLSAALIVVGVVASALAAAPAGAAPDCLASPKGAPPAGGHWNYKLDRASKKPCWYVKSAAEVAAPVAVAPTPAPPQQTTALPSAVANARAELPPAPPAVTSIISPTPLAAAPARLPQAVAAAPALDPQQPWTMASRWQDRGVGIAEPAQPVQFAETAAAPQPETAIALPEAPAPISGTAPRSESGTPLWMLIMAIGGALGFAGLAVGAIMVFARPKRIDRDGFFEAPPLWEAAEFDRAAPARRSPRELDLTPEDITAADGLAEPAISAQIAAAELPDEPAVAAPNWLRIARERQQTTQSSAEIEGLLALARGAASRG
jgi:hypothetical protein